MRLSGSPARPRLGAGYRFYPGPIPDRPNEELLRLRSRLLETVRVAHGMRSGFLLRLRSGRPAALEVHPLQPTGERWVTRTLLPAYRPYEWRRSTFVPIALGTTAWEGRRVGAAGGGPGAGVDPTQILRVLAAGFASVRAGCSLELLVRPAQAPWTPPWWLDFSAPPRHVQGLARAGARAPTVRLPREELGRTEPPVSAPWTASMTVLLSPLAREDGVITMIEAAWKSLDGFGIRLRPTVAGSPRRRSFLLSETELSALLPTWELPGVRGGSSSIGPGEIPLGRNRSGAVVGLPVVPGEGRHTVVLGETGMGKSSLLLAVARRAAADGAVILLDPMGETAVALRDELLAEERPVRHIAPGVPGSGLNVLAGTKSDPDDPTLRSVRRVDDLVHALRRVRSGRYADSGFWGPRLEEMLGRALRAAGAIPNGTLEDAYRLLSSDPGGSRIPPGTDPAVRSLLERVRERPDDAEGARRLLYEVVRDPTLRNMLCSREASASATELFRSDGAILVSGSAAEVGEATARYLLAVFLAVLWSEIVAATRTGKTFVILDEAQWYAHESLAEMLRLGRRRNVHVVLATQSLRSLPEDVREAAQTNAADLVAFRGALEDARDLGRAFEAVSPGQLLSMPRGSALVLLGKGERVDWIRTSWLPGRHRRRATPVFPGETAAFQSGSPPESDGTESAIGVEPLLERIRALAKDAPEGGFVRLELDPGSSAEPAARAWRELGSILGRAHALVSRERTPAGRAWWIDPAKLPVVAREAPSSRLPRSRSFDTPIDGTPMGSSPGGPGEVQAAMPQPPPGRSLPNGSAHPLTGSSEERQLS